MRNIIILLGMLACLFGPTALFTFTGYKSMQEVSKRPTASAGVMIGLITKLIIVAAVLMIILAALLKAFAQ